MKTVLQLLVQKNFVSVRTACLFASVIFTGWSFLWADNFAYAWLEKGGTDGAQLALIIGAVTAPVSAMTRYIYGDYTKSRSGQQ